MKHLWNQKIFNRRIAFWNFIKNKNKAEVYKCWIKSNPLVIPRKFQIKPIINEEESHRKIRERLTMEKFNAEIEMLTLRAISNEQRVNSIDAEMAKEIKNKAENNSETELIKLWKENCITEETKSLQRWEKSLKWFEKYAMEFSTQTKNQNPFIKTYAEAVKQNFPIKRTNANTEGQRNRSTSRQRQSLPEHNQRSPSRQRKQQPTTQQRRPRYNTQFNQHRAGRSRLASRGRQNRPTHYYIQKRNNVNENGYRPRYKTFSTQRNEDWDQRYNTEEIFFWRGPKKRRKRNSRF